MLEEQELRIHASQCRDEEEDTGENERAFTPEVAGKEAREGRADDTADEGT